jgi:hypothetical protein
LLQARHWGNIAPFMKLGERAADLLAIVVVAGLPVGVAKVGAPGPIAATLKLGPNSGGYLTGFAPTYEIEGLFASRWTGYHAQIDLPLEVRRGPVEVSYRFARVLPQTAMVDVALAGQPLDHFTCRGGVYEVRRVRLGGLPPTPVALTFAVDSHDRRNLGLRFDWASVSVGPGGRLALRGRAAWLPGLLAAWLLVLFRWAGHSTARALLLAASVSVAAAAWAWVDPFSLGHVALKIAVPAAILSTLAAAILRRVPQGQWVLAIFVAGYLLKGAGLFHPTTFYPDVQNARRYILSLAGREGSLAARNREAQVETNVGYPRDVAGRPYAFPYSPLFFVPFGALKEPDRIEDAFRHAGLIVAALEVLAVFALARLCAGARPHAALGAALVAAFLPAFHSRLLLAMTVTLAGNLLDTGLVAATLALVMRPESKRRLALVALLAAASVLTYVSSLFTVSAFLLMVALCERRLAPRLLAIMAGAVAVTVGWLYAPFVRVFVTEIVPALVGGEAAATTAAPAAVRPSGLVHTLSRIPLFYGPAYPLLAAGGLALVHRTADRRVFRLLTAYALAFAALLGLRAFGGGLFRDLKEITFVAPLVAVLTGVVLDELASRGRAGRRAAILVAIGLVAFGLARYGAYLNAYASPLLVVSAPAS